MAILEDGSADSLHPFVTAQVEPGTTVVTDGWSGYRGIAKLGYVHEPHSQRAASARGEDASALLPGVHRVDEFCFRFNQRRSRSRGMVFCRLLQLAINHDPVRYRQLVANPQAKPAPPGPPVDPGHPPSLDRPRADRPWRAA